MSIYYYVILWTVVIPVLCEPVNEPTKTRLTILKCCRYNEELVKESDNEADARTHCKATKSEWKPIIYSPSKADMLEKPPAEWDIVEGRKPVCEQNFALTYVPYRITNPFVLMDDGRVIIDVHVNERFEPDTYCADSNALLVCMKNRLPGNAAVIMRPRVKKCCGENATFYEEEYVFVQLTIFLLRFDRLCRRSIREICSTTQNINNRKRMKTEDFFSRFDRLC